MSIDIEQVPALRLRSGVLIADPLAEAQRFKVGVGVEGDGGGFMAEGDLHGLHTAAG